MVGREAGLRTCLVPSREGPDSPQRACAGLSPASQILPSDRGSPFPMGGPLGHLVPTETIACGLVPVSPRPPTSTFTVIGIGADGWAGVPDSLRDLVLRAAVVLGGRRHLDLLPDVPGQRRLPWPSPLRAGLPSLLADVGDGPVVALASGDPLVSGIGTTLIEVLGRDRVVIHPAVSSVALARARLGWPAESCAVVSLVGRDPALVLRELAPGRRVLVLSSDEHTPGQVAGLLTDAGYGASTLHVLGDLGAPSESHATGVGTRLVRRPPRACTCSRSTSSARPRARLDPGPARRRLRARRPAHQARPPRVRPGAARAGARRAPLGRRRRRRLGRHRVDARPPDLPRDRRSRRNPERALRIGRNAARARRARARGRHRPCARGAGRPALRPTRSSSAAARLLRACSTPASRRWRPVAGWSCTA